MDYRNFRFADRNFEDLQINEASLKVVGNSHQLFTRRRKNRMWLQILSYTRNGVVALLIATVCDKRD